ncbi:MAG: protein kinase [Deltaproteobacteria bacterium]|nr:protein kinase [Deltaproteobacteria bacterium]
MEKFCPSCSRAYEDSDLTHCETDGERLVIMQAEPQLVGMVLDGKYTVRAKLGEGGMGTVYVAEQTSMGREVAVKVLRPRFSQNKLAIKRFLREARAASRLTHPSTITVYDSGQTPDGLLYQVMERLNGRPLADVLEAEGALEVTRAVRILAQICDSLAEAHTHGIIHRDLKPENIFIEPTVGNPEFVKVLDFGIAKMAEETGTQATATGMICGTPSYMSPEQTMGRELDGRSDIYAMGVLLYEMVAGERPFHGQSPMEIMLKHINEPPPALPPGVGGPYAEALGAVLSRMMAKAPADRPADSQAAKAELLAVLDPSSADARPAADRAKTDAFGVTESGRKRTASTSLTPVARDASEFTGLSPAVADSMIESLRPASAGWGLRSAAAAAVVLVAGGVAWLVWPRPLAPDAAPVGSGSAAALAMPARTAPGVVPAPSAPSEAGHGGEGPAEPEAPAVAEPVNAGGLAGVAVGAAVFARLAALEATPLVEPVTALIESEPSGAMVRDEGGELLGTTPFSLLMEPGGPPRPVVFSLDGHRTQRAMLDPAVPGSWSVGLRPSPRKVIGSRASKPAPKEPPTGSRPPSDNGFGHGTF